MSCPMFVPCPFSERLENQFLRREINEVLFFNKREQCWYCSARNCSACPVAQEEAGELLDWFSLSNESDERKTKSLGNEANRFRYAETLFLISPANFSNWDAHADKPMSLRKLVQKAKDLFQRGSSFFGG